MEDDGLLLNFAAPSSSSNSKPQLRKSHGKVQNKKSNVVSTREDPKNTPISISQSKAKSTITTSKSSSPSQVERRADGASHPVLPKASSSKVTISNSQPREGSNSRKPRGTAVISSLFAGDDASQSTRDEKTQVRKQFDPSNAPSKASDFTSLQLDPLLIAHLNSEKMKITRPTGIQRTALPFLLSPSSFERDALLHAQTGSGKTLCYLLPIIQSLLPYCQSSWIDRSCLGTLAIILAPTRELARQIYEVAESICSLHLTSKAAEGDEGDETESTVRRTRWIIPGLLSGGATKNHEKSRLRKGLPFIVATPGRLLDHLRNTAALDVGRLQWLVLDEADRLLQLGFEETLNDIAKAIEGRRRAACDVQRQRMRDELGNQYTGQAIEDAEVVDTFGEAWWKHGRRTVLCSATLDEGVQVLAGKNLRQPKLIRSEVDDKTETGETADKDQSANHSVSIAAPAQLSQYYTIVPTKQRLVLLVALLRKCIASSDSAKIMVFLSCTDSVDFHLAALTGVSMSREVEGAEDRSEEQGEEEKKIEFTSSLLPSTSLFKLHGSLSAQSRQSSLKAFSKSKSSSVLLCTSVASRGLDLHVSYVIQVDPPTEKGTDEYLHRIGRTARAGESGESWIFFLPSEEGCVQHYESAIGSKGDQQSSSKGFLQKQEPVSILRDGFGGQDLLQTQTRATDAQMALERWTISNEKNVGLARQAYLSHLRAYASHPPIERDIFAIAKLQLGHLAKAFALREAPGTIRAKVQQQQKEQKVKYMGKEDTKKRKRVSNVGISSEKDENSKDDEEDIFENGREIEKLQFQRNEDTEARMYAKVRELGKLHKRQGVMGTYGGADEFQIA